MSLYSLTEQYRSLLALADSEAEIPEDVLRDTLEGLGGELQLKAQNVARFIANQDAMAEAIDSAGEAMRVRAKRLRNRTAYLRQYLLVNMQAANLPRLESPELVIAIKKNPPSVVVFDEAAIPAEFKRTPPPAPPPVPVPDKKAIGDALKAGTDVPGCRLEQGFRLEVKP
jgi:hypothetical protein